VFGGHIPARFMKLFVATAAVYQASATGSIRNRIEPREFNWFLATACGDPKAKKLSLWLHIWETSMLHESAVTRAERFSR